MHSLDEDPGYIDDPLLGLKGINEDRASGGHFAALWQPSETFSLKLSALYQKITGHNTSDETPNPPAFFDVGQLGNLQQFYIRAVNTYGYDRTAQAYSAPAQLEDRHRRSGRAHRI